MAPNRAVVDAFPAPPPPPLPLLSTTVWPYRPKHVRDVSSGPRGGAFVITAPCLGFGRCVFVSSLEAPAQLPPVCRGHDRGAGRGGEWRGKGHGQRARGRHAGS